MFKTIKTAEEIQAEKDQQFKERRIAELQRLLEGSDYKVLPDYDKTNEDIIADRQKWRDEIRLLETNKNDIY
jgi:hypothetical protein